MKITGTRTYFEIRVGSHQSAEVLLHLRRSDVSWFRQNLEFLRAELLELLQSSVLPRLFADEIERNHASVTKTKLPPDLGPGGIPITVGEKNTAAAAARKNAASKQTSNNNNGNNKRKRGLSKKGQAELKRQREEADRERRRSEKDVHYATGATIRIVYRLEEAAAGRAGATLLFGDTPDGGEDGSGGSRGGRKSAGSSFRALKKLSKRILVWCYPSNAEQPVGEGFLRPEVVPIASLFRVPAAAAATKEVIEVDDD